MPHDPGSSGSWHPGDPHGLRVLRLAFLWAAGVLAIWATLRVVMITERFLVHYAVALVLLLAAVLLGPVYTRLRRPREPF